ncbi:hypothetical protein KC332_g55 [Hortaea werneckii]|nr:hypothetical protein KC332_g55 [Hortaea werneckii]
MRLSRLHFRQNMSMNLPSRLLGDVCLSKGERGILRCKVRHLAAAAGAIRSLPNKEKRTTWLVKLGWEEAGSWGLCSLGAHLLIARFAVKLHTHTFNVVCRCAGTWSMCWQVRQQIIEERGKKASAHHSESEVPRRAILYLPGPVGSIARYTKAVAEKAVTTVTPSPGFAPSDSIPTHLVLQFPPQRSRFQTAPCLEAPNIPLVESSPGRCGCGTTVSPIAVSSESTVIPAILTCWPPSTLDSNTTIPTALGRRAPCAFGSNAASIGTAWLLVEAIAVAFIVIRVVVEFDFTILRNEKEVARPWWPMRAVRPIR